MFENISVCGYGSSNPITDKLRQHLVENENMRLEAEAEKRIRETVAEETSRAFTMKTPVVNLLNTLHQPVQPKKKLDWSKIPVDTLVEVSENASSWTIRYYSQNILYRQYMRLAGQEVQPWAVWQPTEDSVCPLPDGVMVEVILRNGDKDIIEAQQRIWCTSPIPEYQIIAYKIVGLAEGWEY